MSPLEIPALMLVGMLVAAVLRREAPATLTKLSELLKFIAIDLMLPLFLFSSVVLSGSPRDLLAFLIAMLVPSVSLLTALVLFRGDPEFREGVMLSLFGNITILGLPVIKALGLPEATALAAISGYNLVYLSVTPFIATLDLGDLWRGFKRAVSSPIFISFLLAILLKLYEVALHVSLPVVAVSTLHIIKALTLPSLHLMALYFGFKVELRELDLKFTLKVLFSKMVAPVLALLVLAPFLREHLSRDVYEVILILSSMPPAILANAFVSQFHLNEGKSYSTTLILTLISLLWLLI